MYELLGNQTRFYDLFTFANTATGGIFGYLLILMIWVISYFSMKQYTDNRAFAFSTFITTIMAIMLSVIGIVNSQTVIICVIMTGLSIIYLFKTQ